jgi:uncharacterized protein (DUF2336 family)
MFAATSLIPELEDIVQHSSRERRAEALRRITTLFVDGAPTFNDDHVQLFDEVFSHLIAEIEAKARAALASQLAPVDNAPPTVVRQLAQDDDITVAAPVLTHSRRLDDKALVEIAKSKGQAHLLAIAGRPEIGVAVTDVLVNRGDREVVRNVADNLKAKLSDSGFSTLIKRAEGDGVLAQKVGQRPDIPPHLFRALLMQATDLVQKRLLSKAKPETAAEIRRVLAKVSSEIGAKAAPRDYSEAQRTIAAMKQAGQLNERELASFAREKCFEETVVGLSVLCAVPIEVMDRLMGGERADPILILCRAAGFSWQTVRAIILSRPVKPGVAVAKGLDEAQGNFERLSASTAQRVVSFWQVRPARMA